MPISRAVLVVRPTGDRHAPTAIDPFGLPFFRFAQRQRSRHRPDRDARWFARARETWLEANPYRGNPLAVSIGQTAYGQTCARCHGADASTNATPAPDLRQLNRFCRRITDPGLSAACMRDNDAYFARTVRKGKIIVGVTHMPPWEGVLKQELAWAIQTFIESRASGGKK